MKADDAIVWACGSFNIAHNELWFVPYEQNLLCRYSIEKNMVTDVITLDLSPFQVESFDNVYRTEDKIFMIPAFEKHLHVFDMSQRESRLVSMPEYTGVGEKFLLAYQYEGWIYLFPSFFDKILRIDIHTLKTEEGLSQDAVLYNAFCDMEVLGNKAYLVNRDNKIYIFDFESGGLSIGCQLADASELRTISSWHDKLIVTDQKGRVFVCDLAEKKEVLFAEYGIEFIGAYCIDSFLFLIPLLEKDFFLKVNLGDHCTQRIELRKKEKYKIWPHRVFSRACVYKDCLYFFSTQYRTLIKYNYRTGILEENCLMIDPISITRSALNGWLKKEAEAGNTLIEGKGPYTTLSNFIEFCINS